MKAIENNLKILTINIRSYRYNRNAIEYLILKEQANIMIITETWLKNSISIPSSKYKYIDLLSTERG